VMFERLQMGQEDRCFDVSMTALFLQVERMLNLVLDLESTPYSMGSNSTSFWMKDFNNYRQYFTEDNDR
ncbi:hypothetical protein TELCIR_22265, partial [Teladorsagia circumcincta]